ncbi:hypothetical protein CJJ23_01055 [Mycoplasmopsis agassizii]|uniref:Fatty acid-binding protein DegV-like protein n=1 Tax=Mycoplasmopsis agassizii TaxID=33922 RepID=A0A269TK24_9BACT|nr:DegV family protein [Mycoplasmopsis agassizii]PAK21707.1 hypothetical protein CJJ23_01055 [Mycoplasmopsis agassizii]
MKIAIIIDSASGLSKAEAEKLNWHYLPLGITIDDKFYQDGIDVTSKNIYDFFNPKSKVQTSATPPALVEELFEKLSQENDKVIVFPISKHLSSQYQNLAATAMKFKNVHVVKSNKVAMLIPLALLDFEKALAEGQDFETSLKKLEIWKEEQKILLIPYSNDRLVAGGRLSPAAAKVAKLLKITPVIKFEDGQLLRHAKGLVFDKVINNMMKELTEESKDKELESTPVILHANNPQIDEFIQEFETISGSSVFVGNIPSVVAIHTGHKAIALANNTFSKESSEKLQHVLNSDL